MNTHVKEFIENGFVIIPSFVSKKKLIMLKESINPLLHDSPCAGVRGLAKRMPVIQEFAMSSAVLNLVQQRIGKNAKLVRSVLFNKGPEINWLVTWHQDLSIAVQSKANVIGYGNWSKKDNIHHVQPPLEVLDKFITVRIHLDDANQNNGALIVAPGTHKLGRIPASEASTVATQVSECVCSVRAGDALLFHPLLLHASRKATNTHLRRVIHLEYSSAILPKPLQWSEAA